MTEAQRIAKGQRAQAAYDEFLAPMFDEIEAEYASRMIEVANNELSREARADKITALSHAIKIARTLKAGMRAAIADGDVAHREKLRADTIEKMTAPRRRLLGIAPQR